jgi:hypothetical protein
MATYNYWTLTDERCLTATKLTKLQLDTEAAFFKPYMEGTTYTGQQRKKKSHLETNVPTHVHFFIYLLYCNHYPRLYFAAWALKMPEADLHKSLKRTSAAIARAARDTNLSLGVHGRPTLPTAAELAAIKEKQKGMKNKGLETAEFVVDGEFHPHPAPSIGSDHDDLRKSLWRAKYNAFGQMIIKVTTLTGIVIYCSPLSTRSEQTLLRESGVLEYCRKTGSGIVTDGGYVVNVRGTKESDLVDAFFTLGPTGIGSARALAAAEGAPGDVREEARRILVTSSMASQMRLVVENRNALECTWAVLSQPFRQALNSGVYSLNLSDVELGLVFIDNRRLLFHKELRAADWKPKALTTRPDATYWYPGNRQSAQSVARWLAKKLAEVPGKAGEKARKKASSAAKKEEMLEANFAARASATVTDTFGEGLEERGDYFYFDDVPHHTRAPPAKDDKEKVRPSYVTLDEVDGWGKKKRKMRTK